MSDAIVALLGWNSITRGWNDGAWNTEVAFPSSTGAVGAVTVTGDASVSVTGVSASSAIGDYFTTNMGLATTSTLGSFFSTNTSDSMTGSVGAATITGDAIINVTGVSATGEVGAVAPSWGLIIPSQTPGFANITVSQTSNFTKINPSQDPTWTDLAA